MWRAECNRVVKHVCLPWPYGWSPEALAGWAWPKMGVGRAGHLAAAFGSEPPSWPGLRGGGLGEVFYLNSQLNHDDKVWASIGFYTSPVIVTLRVRSLLTLSGQSCLLLRPTLPLTRELLHMLPVNYKKQLVITD